jgi:hypothetical protein
MKPVAFVAALALAMAGCDDKPTTPPNKRTLQGLGGPTRMPQPNDPQPKYRPPEPGTVWLPITRSFDGHVLAKHTNGFEFRGLSGKKYLLIPTNHLTDKPKNELAYINYEQIQINQKLRVHLSMKLLVVDVYLCEGVVLHGVKYPNGREMFGGLTDISDEPK